MNRRALENTLPALAMARDFADGVELDVQLARCGTPVVFHDDALEQIFGVPGVIGDYTAAELAELEPSPSSDFSIPYSDWKPSPEERIPTLAQALDLFDDDFLVNVEIKAPTVRLETATASVAQMLDERSGNYLVSSFNPIELARFARLNRRVPIALLFGPDSNYVLRQGWSAPVLGVAGLVAIHPNWKLVSPDLIERAHGRGWRVHVWTVNDAERAAWLRREGVDAIISDVPDVLGQTLE
jgi:glycerophosphoryl diester phosphodiesterase